ncbi:MAG: ABC transporter permease [bacterium]|nr:ABC transporter permease [bacterium]
MRYQTFSKRVIKELVREPLSYIFCVGFPLVMLVVMTLINQSIPKEANMDIFKIQYLCPGIAVFGLTFVMLFVCLQVSKDRSSAFLLRLYASPMKSFDFIAGYTFPVMLLAVAQIILCFGASFVIGCVSGYTFHILNMLIALLSLLPTALLFIGFGMLFGTLLGEKTSPPLCSIVISVASILGGVWMDVDAMGGGLLQVAKVLPFYYSVKVTRYAMFGEYSDMIRPLLVLLLYMAVIYILALFVFRKKMQSDIK